MTLTTTDRRNRILQYQQVLVLIIGLACSIETNLLAQTVGPSRDPILRIETGMHTAKITRISVDAANRFLVTGSHDKTVRVWELPSGRLLRVLRPPVGAGNEGKIYAVAISPDGQTIAAGGWTGYEWEKAYSIYLFDRGSGQLIQRISGLPNVVNHLVYSPDGRYLAAALGGKYGVRVFETSSYSQIGEEKEYGDPSFGADFDAADRLVTTSDDGYIRLYELAGSGTERSLRLVAKQKAPGGDRPFGVRFSPDGRRIAVGFYDNASVNVLDAGDLSLLYAPDTSGAKNNLFAVTWSFDGNFLYAVGKYLDANNHKAIRSWANSGRGRYRDLPVSNDTILDLLPLRTGGVVYGTADPAFGTIDASGKQTLFKGPDIADYRNSEQGFLLSSDASTVRFSYDQSGKSRSSFSISGRQLDTSATSVPSNLQPSRTEAQGLNIAGWRGTDEPKLNGQPLKLKQYETSRSLAITPDASGFLLGTEFYVRYFDRTGAEKWKVPAPGIAWTVNISGDGRAGVAALGDGTIRLYRITDGKELLAFFPHADRKRWVMWTPSGYYDASPGAEDLIGWHVNNGKEAAADFFPAGQFRSTFYRPDVVAKVLQTGDEALALKLANEETGRKQQQVQIATQLPPVIQIISPSDNIESASTTLRVRFSLRSPSGEPVTSVKALVDGRPVDGSRQLLRESSPAGTGELSVTIPQRDCEVALVAENRYASSVPSVIRVRWKGTAAAVTPNDEFVVKPKLYVLAVGVSEYGNSKLNLGFAAKDAQDFAAALQRQKGGLYRDVIVKIITNAAATRDEIVDGLDWIRKETTSKDVAVVFLAGHGVNDSLNRYFFCPYNIDADKLLRTGVAFSDIKSAVESIAGKTLFFVDTCHSGNVLGGSRSRDVPDITGFVNELSSAENGAIVFAASTGNQVSLENKEWNNGAFTKALIEGIDGGADYLGKGKITINMLDLFISERVKTLTGGRQTPTTTKPQTVPDFPFAVKRS
jgi:WD40 repeat protein